MISVLSALELSEHIGKEVISQRQLVISGSMIEAFVKISKDQQWIHQASAAPRIVPANLLISLIPRLLQACLEVKLFSRCLTVKYENIRFKRPVVAGDTIELHMVLTEVRARFDQTFVSSKVTLINVADGKDILIAKVTDCYEGSC
ncbi:MAG: MaoC family dehydratase [Pseudomonadota bacterium]|nr:MaoC family dehydratase [Pseudomonadota bacterium]